MTIEHLSFIETNRLSESGLDIFFKKTFEQLLIELQRLRETLYNYEDHRYLFELNETSWVGLLNTAIVKAFPESANCLLEFTVYEDDSMFGRGDLLVSWRNPKCEELYILFEAKQYFENKLENMLGESKDYLDDIKEQAHKYFKAETKYYKGKKVFIVPIAFGSIRDQQCLDEAKRYFGLTDKVDTSSDFCSLYYEGSNGVWAYGYAHQESVK